MRLSSKIFPGLIFGGLMLALPLHADPAPLPTDSAPFPPELMGQCALRGIDHGLSGYSERGPRKRFYYVDVAVQCSDDTNPAAVASAIEQYGQSVVMNDVAGHGHCGIVAANMSGNVVAHGGMSAPEPPGFITLTYQTDVECLLGKGSLRAEGRHHRHFAQRHRSSQMAKQETAAPAQPPKALLATEPAKNPPPAGTTTTTTVTVTPPGIITPSPANAPESTSPLPTGPSP